MFRKKTRGQVIGAELQEGLTHIGIAVAEAGRAAAEQLGPRVEAAQKAAGPALEAAQKAVDATVTPRVTAAVAAAAPAVATARDTLAPRVGAAQKAFAPRVEAATKMAAPRLEAAQKAVDAGLVAAVEALTPRVEAAVEAAQRALTEDVVPRLGAAPTAALAYATPKVAAARDAVAPVLENARTELGSRGGALVATAAGARTRSAKGRSKGRGRSGRKAVVASGPRRWPWFVVAAATAVAAFVLLRRTKSSDDLWPAPTGDGPVPSYREDPVPSSPSDSGKTVSAAQTAPGDATPPDSDLGMWAQQQANPAVTDGDVPEPSTSTGASEAVSTSINEPGGESEGPGGVSPTTDATNDTDSTVGEAGTPLANRGQEPEGGPNPA